jgi:hypothetical protein
MQIPFCVKRLLNKRRIFGSYKVYYHDEKIDKLGFEDWELDSSRRSHEHDDEFVCVGVSEDDSNNIEGCK